MPITCEACKENINVTQKRIKCTSCFSTYHSECVNYGENSVIRASWKCPNCIVSQRKSNNTNTPLPPEKKQHIKNQRVNDTHTIASQSQNTQDITSSNTVNCSNLIRSLEEMLDNKLKIVKEELIEQLKATIFLELKNEILSLSSYTSQLQESYNNIQLENDTIKKDLELLQNRVSTAESEVLELRSQIGKQQQIARLNNLEVLGLPQISNECPTDLIIKIAKHAGVNLQEKDIEFAHRVQPFTKVQGRPKPIVTKLKDRKHKDAILSGLRRQRAVNTSDIGLGGKDKRIFVNEHLTPENKLLLKRAKVIAKQNAFKFVWVKNCNIFLRKNEDSPVIYINCDKDLSKVT